MSSSLRHKILSGVFWQGLERVGSQGINFVISIMLARLLAPKDFGVIALMMVFITLCNVVVDSGFGNALIQKKDADELDFCSVFFINIALGVALYVVMFLVAPSVARFYESPDLVRYLRFSSLTLVITSFSRVQQAFLNKNMLFHLSFRISWVSLLVSGMLGIAMAYRGFGVWALIAQQLCNAIAQCLLLWLLVKWRPQWLFDWTRAKVLFRFGGKLFCSGLLDRIYQDIYSILIGRLFNLETLSFFERGRMFPSQGMQVVNSTIGSVMFPALSRIQNAPDRMREVSRKAIRASMFCIVPSLIFILVVAEPLVRALLTEKWLPCVVFVRLNCLIFLFWPLHVINLQILTACGRSDLFLYIEILKKTQVAVMIFCTYKLGVIAMVGGLVILAPLSFVENAWFSKRLIGYPFWRQFGDILPTFLVSAVAGVGCVAIAKTSLPAWGMIAISAVVFGVIYLGAAIVLKICPEEIFNIVKQVRGRN